MTEGWKDERKNGRKTIYSFNKAKEEHMTAICILLSSLQAHTFQALKSFYLSSCLKVPWTTGIVEPNSLRL